MSNDIGYTVMGKDRHVFLRKIKCGYEDCLNKTENLLQKKGRIALLLFVYKLLFDAMYCFCIANTYPYFFLNIRIINVVSALILTIVLAIATEKMCKRESPSTIIIMVLILLYYIPMLTYCSYGNGSSASLLFSSIYFSILLTLQFSIPIYSLEIKKIEKTDALFYIITIVASVISLYVWAKYSHFRIFIDIFNVYGIRAEAAALQLPAVLKFANLMMRIAVGMLLVYALYMKKWIFVIWYIFITIINFSFEGSKMFLFMPFLIISVYVVYRKGALRLFIPMGILGEILGIIEYRFGNAIIINFVFRRLGALPVQISDLYYKFFSENVTDIFRHGIMSKLGFTSPYMQEIPNVIGNNYMSQVVNYNNGLLADVWSGFGIAGLIIMPIILIVCFRMFDFTAYDIDPRLYAGLAMYFAVIFTNAQWSTILFSHGFLLMCIGFVIFPRKDKLKGQVLCK